MVVQVYITKKFRLIQTETRPFKPIKWGGEPSGYSRCFNANWLQNIHTRSLVPLGIQSVIFILSV